MFPVDPNLEGAPDHTRRAHEAMARGELVHPDVAFGRRYAEVADGQERAREEWHNLDARLGAVGNARSVVGAPSSEAHRGFAESRKEPSPPVGGIAPGRPARGGNPGDPLAPAGDAPQSRRGAANPAAAGTQGAGGGDREATARPSARRRGVRQAAAAGQDERDETDRRHAHAAQDQARRWWRVSAATTRRAA